MRSELKLLGVSCLAVAALTFATGHAQEAGAAPAGAAPAGVAPGGAPAAAGGMPPGAGDASAQGGGGGAPPGAAPASSPGGMPPGVESNTPSDSGAPTAASQAASDAAAAAEDKRAQQEAEDRKATEAAAAAADQVVDKPRAAYMVPLAADDLMLDVTKAGGRAVAVGSHGDIVISDDGVNWTQSPSPVRQLLTAVTFANASDGWAVGHDAVIVHTADGGKTWTLQSYEPKLQAPLLNVFFLDAQRGFAMGAFGLLRETMDGGRTWKDVSADSIRTDQLNFYDMIKLDDGSLLIAGEQGMLGLSVDQGANWQKLKSPYPGSYFGALPAGKSGALVFGLRGTAYITDDVVNGPWRQVQTNTKASFFGGVRQADGSFILVGGAGTIMRISADGSSVKLVPGPSDQDYDAALPMGAGLVLAGARGMQQLKSLQ